jgi:hypothetical protein
MNEEISPNWIPLTDKGPNDVTPVLVYGECCDTCYHILIAELEEGWWFESATGEDLTFEPTHWMELPEPPSKKNTKN